MELCALSDDSSGKSCEHSVQTKTLPKLFMWDSICVHKVLGSGLKNEHEGFIHLCVPLIWLSISYCVINEMFNNKHSSLGHLKVSFDECFIRSAKLVPDCSGSEEE